MEKHRSKLHLLFCLFFNVNLFENCLAFFQLQSPPPMDELQILINKAESLRGLLPREPKDADRCIAEVVLVDLFNFLNSTSISITII